MTNTIYSSRDNLIDFKIGVAIIDKRLKNHIFFTSNINLG